MSIFNMEMVDRIGILKPGNSIYDLEVQLIAVALTSSLTIAEILEYHRTSNCQLVINDGIIWETIIT